jgi:anti-sigma factor RsiW
MSHETDVRRWELLSAHVDGELDRATAAAVEQGLRLDPEMADEMAALQRQRDAMQDWAAAVGERPVPVAVRALLQRARRSASTSGNWSANGHCAIAPGSATVGATAFGRLRS